MCLKKSVVIMNATLQFIYIYIYIFSSINNITNCQRPSFSKKKKKKKNAKGLVTELTSPHAQNAWRFRGESVRDAGLTVCCNYFSKKKITN